MATKTAEELHPAYGNLHAAVLQMAVRYAEAHTDWTMNLNARRSVYDRLRRTHDRRYRALARLTAALANR